jgi:hypothetical protein
MTGTLSRLIQRLGEEDLSAVRVIPWSSPVPTFGDPENAQVATLGLNPSNLEFVDERGDELDGPRRRFHTLSSLGLQRWSDASKKDERLIWEACCRYFGRNPYDNWFRQLDYIIGQTRASYYQGGACHLDLIPFATSCKWTDLAADQKRSLLTIGSDVLGPLLSDSRIRVLVLNGRSVVSSFAEFAGVTFAERRMERWDLARRSSRVPGYAYMATIDRLGGQSIGRDVLVLGFNHNIQSSFGVTRMVRHDIRQWIGTTARAILR